MSSPAIIYVTDWTCGDGCCSETNVSVDYEGSCYDFESVAKAEEFCVSKGWMFTVEESTEDYSMEDVFTPTT